MPTKPALREWVHLRIDQILDWAETVELNDGRDIEEIGTSPSGCILRRLTPRGEFALTYVLSEENNDGT